MKHIKTYENWFTNLFKGGDSDLWQNFMDDTMGDKFSTAYNALMGAAEEGNWTRFKNNFNEYSAVINAINKEFENGKEIKRTLLMHIVIGSGDLWEKKKMLKMVLDYNDVDIYIENEKGQNFYEMIEDSKLKKWFDYTYPDIVEKLERKKQEQKYNL